MRLTTALFAMTLPALAFATPETDALVAEVEARYTGVETISADFTQTVRNAMFGDDVQQGTMVLSRPNKMNWRFGDGERAFVSDGDNMWIYSQADNQVIHYDGFNPTAGGAESLLTSLDQLDELFDVALAEGEGKRLSLTPKTPGQVKSVLLVLTDDLSVDEVVITDPFDNVTELDFGSMQLNPTVEATTFAFTVPEGANVIEAGSL